VFHLLLAMVQRAESFGVPASQDITYSAGTVFCLAGTLLAMAGFVAVLARRH
jgi:NADH:ubiquinone oxidoreductase subunit 6 (subunit J)